MKKVTINVLASDFKNNSYMNSDYTMNGCPLQRAFMRAGVVSEGEAYNHYMPSSVNEYDQRVIKMFNGDISIRDFSFEIEIPA